MSATLSYDLKKCMKALTQDGRWNVLTVLILHCNIRNRCFVGVVTIAEMATNGNRNRANRAKKWLEDHGAFELVPVKKRMDDELKLPPRQNVYQLTGALSQCSDVTCECHQWDTKKIDYLHYGTIESITIDTNEILPKNINGETNKRITIDNINGETGSITSISKKKKESAPQNGAVGAKVIPERVRNPMFDAVAMHVFKTTDPNAKGGRIAKISTWLEGKNEGREKLGFISKSAKPEHVRLFADWCKEKGITAPLDLTKFVEQWRAWALQANHSHHVSVDETLIPDDWAVDSFLRKPVSQEIVK